MKKLVLALTAVAAFSGSAFAADMAPHAYSKAPAPIAAAPSWTGFWISGGFGYGLTEMSHSTVSTAVVPATFDFGHDNGGKGWLGKVGIGYDYQFAGSFVIGAFADAQWTNIKGNYSFNCPAGCFGPNGFIGSINNDWSWSAGGRIGYAALPSLLTYLNAGWSQANFSQVNYADATFGTATGLVMGSRRQSGYFIGGGTEYAITQFPGLFWKSEVRLYDYGNQTLSQLCTVTGPCGVAGTIHSIDRSHTYEQTATTELVYRFNWGGR